MIFIHTFIPYRTHSNDKSNKSSLHLFEKNSSICTTILLLQLVLSATN